jgi:hypothetical protein
MRLTARGSRALKRAVGLACSLVLLANVGAVMTLTSQVPQETTLQAGSSPVTAGQGSPAIQVGTLGQSLREQCRYLDPAAEGDNNDLFTAQGERNDYYQCLEETLVVTATQDPTRAMATLLDLSLADQRLAAVQCHEIAHQVGKTAYESLGAIQALQISPTMCAGGYIHGVMEYALDHLDQADVLLAQCLSAAPTAGAYLRYQCLHGYGHLVGMGPVTSLKDVLNMCAPLVKDDIDYEGCTSGVTGAISHRYRHSNGSDSMALNPSVLDPDALRVTCTQLQGPYSSGCWRGISTFWTAAGLLWNEQARMCVASNHPLCGVGMGLVNPVPTMSQISTMLESPVCSAFGSLRPSAAAKAQQQACWAGRVFVLYQRAEFSGLARMVCQDAPLEAREVCLFQEGRTRSIDASLTEAITYPELSPVIRLLL